MEVKNIRVSSLKSTNNSRMEISSGDVSGLMRSIKEEGLLQPIGVLKAKAGYEICYGHRRYTAYKKLGYKTIPAVVLEKEDSDEVDVLAKNLTENVQRSNLTLSEVGRYIKLLEGRGLRRTEIAARTGLSVAKIKDCLNVFSYIPEEIRPKIVVLSNSKKLGAGEISLSIVRSINSAAKINSLNKREKDLLYKMATVTGFNASKIKEYIEEIRNNKNKNHNETVKEVNERTIYASFKLIFDRDEYAEVKEMAKGLGYKKVRDYLVAVYNREEKLIIKAKNR